MEYFLTPQGFLDPDRILCLNPYFNGILSDNL